jgi:hypothetical protein
MPGQGLLGSNAPLPRGSSPSFNSKAGELAIKNRGTISSSVKKQQERIQLRPGSAPKMRSSVNEKENPAHVGIAKGQNSSVNQFAAVFPSSGTQTALKVD